MTAAPAGAPDHDRAAPAAPAAAIAFAAQAAAGEAVDDEDGDAEPEEQRQGRGAAMLPAAPAPALRPGALGRRGSLLGLLQRRLELGDDRVAAGEDPARIVIGAEARQNLFLDDLVRQRVGHDRLQPVADLDPHPLLVGRDQQDDAIVRALLADVPGPAELIAIILDRHVLQAGDRRHDQLPRGGALQRLQLLGELRLLLRAQQIGLVDHPAAERREAERGPGGAHRQDQEQQSGQRPSGAHGPARKGLGQITGCSRNRDWVRRSLRQSPRTAPLGASRR